MATKKKRKKRKSKAQIAAGRKLLAKARKERNRLQYLAYPKGAYVSSRNRSAAAGKRQRLRNDGHATTLIIISDGKGGQPGTYFTSDPMAESTYDPGYAITRERQRRGKGK